MNNKKLGDKVERFSAGACYTIKFKSYIIHMFFKREMCDSRSDREA